ncbi:MAG TPA: response regulator transcription factor [Kofleriaceae bacterium]|nr:response regulator transcription factor [Kofleriaceae bacterium]
MEEPTTVGQAAPRILLVEDDLKLAALVAEFLRRSGYQVIVVHRGDVAVGALVRHDPDLVVLDLMLPGKDGFTVCREARSVYAGPILMLTARGDDVDEILGLEIGADDYLRKPVRPRVLLARIRSLLRRADDSFAAEPRRIELGALVINAAARTVELGGAAIELTGAEFDLLWALARAAGTPVSRDDLSRACRGIPYDGQDRTIDLRIASLRAKLGDTQRPPTLIKSIRGVGYQLAVDRGRP